MHQSKLGASGLQSGDQGIALMGSKTGLTQQPGRFFDHQILRTLKQERTSRDLSHRCSQRIKASLHADGLDGTSKSARAR
jgi:hypothetical protein